MTLLIGAVLALFSIAIVAYPFLKSRLRAGSGDGRSGAESATELGNIYDAIRTLQLEYQLGQVPDNLYRGHLREYRLQAAVTLRQRMKDQASAPDWLLEQEVLAARAVLRAANGGPRPCPSCRSLPGPGLGVCPECGAELGDPSPET
jgi:hypothetical protein